MGLPLHSGQEQLVAARLPPLSVHRRVPHLWHQKRSLGPELPSPPGPHRRGAPEGSFSVMPPHPGRRGRTRFPSPGPKEPT